MQLIGVYINEGNKKILKNLSTGWYPFGDYKNCHDFFDENGFKDSVGYAELIKSIKDNQNFNRNLYSVKESSVSPEIPINISCIVGKNGSGKSSLLSIVYRIVNNFSCEIKSHLDKHNTDYHPVWATGFNAELYYELCGGQNKTDSDPLIYCLKIDGNYNCEYGIKIGENILPENAKVTLFTKDSVIYDSIKTPSEFYNDEKYLKLIQEYFFYTVGTNYSLYTNSVVTDEWDYNEEKWLGNIYHKNDGYFTPIVLVPYKSEWTTIDTKKELELAKERLSTLSLLIYLQTECDFIENLIPNRIYYELIKSEEKDSNGKEVGYLQTIHYKTERTIRDYYYYCKDNEKSPLKEDELENLEKTIKNIWDSELFSNKIDFTSELYKTIKENTLAYLTYKTIKICLYYDEYKNRFSDEHNKDILKQYKSAPDSCIYIVEDIIKELIKTDSKEFFRNFTNLKIKQCISFLDNLDFYCTDKFEKTAEQFKSFLVDKIKISTENIDGSSEKDMLSYDFVFENLLPPYFKKQFYFSKTTEDTDNLIDSDKRSQNITISSLSSGESQLLNSLSYSIYHIKNAVTSTINYKNINLIFDEAELYYHPEYQRTFIKDLLGIIGRSHLDGVAGINITFVTHSPFILSDIPSQNLLCLKEGKMAAEGITSTLGANFYDLLKNQFFMDSSIGAVTERIINKIIDDFNIIQYENISENRKNEIRNEYQKSSRSLSNFYDSFVRNLSDEYLKSTLKNMIGIIRKESFKERRIKELKDKIKKLEGKNNA